MLAVFFAGENKITFRCAVCNAAPSLSYAPFDALFARFHLPFRHLTFAQMLRPETGTNFPDIRCYFVRCPASDTRFACSAVLLLV